MMQQSSRTWLLAGVCWIASSVFAADLPEPSAVVFTQVEIEQISHLSLSPSMFKPDPSNRYASDAQAAQLGKSLFFDKRLSSRGDVSCASCHDPQQGWTTHDSLMSLRGITLSRHIPSLWNVAAQRWFFWDGRADSLWTQALDSLENEAESQGDRTALVRLVAEDTTLLAVYKQVFGDWPSALALEYLPRHAKPKPKNSTVPLANSEVYAAWDALAPDVQSNINQVTANLLKAIAAFETTLRSGPTPFDRFAAVLSSSAGKADAKALTIPEFGIAAQQGLRLFIGQAGCVRCHYGPLLSDGEFHRIMFSSLPDDGDAGRYDGIPALLANPFNTLGAYADGVGTYRNKLAYVARSATLRATFKTPSLRNVSQTAPYMHTGKMGTLAQVVAYYNTLQPDRYAHEMVLKPLHLSKQEQQYLVDFLQTLTPTP